MQVIIMMPFRDRYTAEIYSQGDVIDITLERFQEIAAAGNFVKKMPVPRGGKNAKQS